MLVSHNEVLLTVQKAFEGLGFPPGDYEDAGFAVAWLELHGLPGLAELARFLPHLPAQRDLPVTVAAQTDDELVLDAHGRCALLSGWLGVDFAYARAFDEPVGRTTTHHCPGGLLALPYLVRAAQRGVHGAARWGTHGARVQANAPFPALFACQEPFVAADTWQVDVSQQTLLFPELAGRTIVWQRRPEDLAAAYEARKNAGIPVDDALWSTLQEMAKAVLVPENPRSLQRGAGEQAPLDDQRPPGGDD